MGMGGGQWSEAWGPQSDEDSKATILKTIDLGINWLDTAPIYGFGHSEKIIGDAVSGLKDKLLISTKCGMVWDQSQRIQANLKPQSIRQELEDSLRRLRRESVDLYQIQTPLPEHEIGEAWLEIGKFIKEGKVRFAGLGNFSEQQIEQLQKIRPVSFIQAPYNIFNRDLESHMLDFCGSNGIGVISYDPLKNGSLSGSVASSASHGLKHEILKKLARLARRHGKTPAQMSVAWCLRKQEITGVAVGARNSGQIEEIAAASDYDVSLRIRAEIYNCIRNRNENIFSKIWKTILTRPR